MSKETSNRNFQPSSLYLDDAYYSWLNRVSSDLQETIIRDDHISTDIKKEITHLLIVEARLLDQGAHKDWLNLFSEQCIYWVPAAQPANDPKNAVTLEFHDRRRLLDRIARLETGVAYSQVPPSRVSHLISGVEIWASKERAGDWHIRYSSLISEFRAGRSQLLAGWNGFVIRREKEELKIVVKQINLTTSDQPLGNNSFFL